MYADLCDYRLEILKPFVSGRRVWDLGCGSSRGHANALLRLGVSELHLVDKLGIQPHKDKRVYTYGETYFKDIKALGHEDVAFVSYPVTGGARGLGSCVQDAGLIIYIGMNDFITACGDIELWNVLLRREPVSVDERGQRDRMIIYSNRLRTRPRLEEEIAAIDSVNWGESWI